MGQVLVVPDPENYKVGQRLNNECFVVAVNATTKEVFWASAWQVHEPHLPAKTKGY